VEVSVPPRVSVVVPVFDVAPYVGACLESLARQSFADLEVIVVDDGSTDGSGEIAAGFVARDGRFRLVRQANAGLGAARNTGAAHAAGEFLAFVDSDDVVPRHAYELLVGALDETGSDFASGNVRRLTPVGTPKAGFLARAIERTRLRTHITRFPPLLFDRTAWNKLFRRSFWERHGFRFPQGVYYEDIPVTLPAHYLAKTVDVVDETVYLWRMREGDDLSITQRRTETKALRDRVAAVDHVSRFLAGQGLAVSKALYDRSVLGADLRYFLDVLPIAGEEYRRLFLDLVNEFVDRADEWALQQPLAIERLKWQLVRRRALPELLEVLRFADEELGERPPIRVGRHWYGDYPFRTDERLRIPAKVFRLEDELAPVARVDELRWEGNRLRVEGTAYIGMLGAPRPDSQTVELVVRRPGWIRRRLRVETEPVHRPDATAESAQQFASLDWCGFVAELDAAELGRGSAGVAWELGVVIRAGGLVRTTWRWERSPLKTLPLADLALPGGGFVRAGQRGRRLSIQAQRRPSVVGAYTVDDGVLQLDGEAGSFSSRAPALRLRRRLGGAAREYPLSVDRSERRSFTGRIPLAELVGEIDSADEAAHLEEQADGVVWEAFLAGNGEPRLLTAAESLAQSTFPLGDREIAVGRASTGAFTVTERAARPVLTDAGWSAGGVLRLTGTFQGPEAAHELVLSARGRPETFAFPLSHAAAGGRFSCELTPGTLPSPAGERSLAEGLWDLLVRRQGAGPDSALGVVPAEQLLARLPLSTRIGPKPFHLGVVDGETPVLAVERDLEDDARGGYAQRRLRTQLYPSRRAESLTETVAYLSFGGTAYADNPRAVHEELVRRDAPLEHVWVVRDGAFRAPETAEVVRRGSREFYELLARARYVVTNDHWPRWFRRRPGQTCLQTWHGAPLKGLGPDLSERPKAVRAHRRFLASRPGPQVVVSPGPWATPLLERAFPGADVLETGLPRTDLLLQSDRDRLRADAKRRVGAEGKRVVLYAPTYRDDLEYRPGTRVSPLRDLPTYRSAVVRLSGYRLGHLLDLEALSTALGSDHVVLFRKHHRVVEALPAEVGSLVRDVSGYPDAIELLLAADVLITDYSSLAFDFAASGRPLLFFTPDLEAYRDDVRGLSLDLDAVAPGPLLRTTDEVIDALRDLDAVAAEHRPRYEAFVDVYCPLADGRASARVVERVFTR
jgi:CDP-glycerol glycerophosphotransferase